MPTKVKIEDIMDSEEENMNVPKEKNVNISFDNDDSNNDNTDIDIDLDLNDITDQPKENKEESLLRNSSITTASIKKGTILYHHSKVELFDPEILNLNDGTCLSAFFTDSKESAKERMKNCMKFPHERDYIHVFKVVEPIDKIFILSQFNLSDWDKKIIDDKYCNGKNLNNDKYNGVGFYLMKKPISEKDKLTENNVASKDYAICNPKRYLEYIHTVRCDGVRRASKPYRIN